MNNEGALGLSYQEEIHEGISITMSTVINTKTFHQGGHKAGIGIELTP